MIWWQPAVPLGEFGSIFRNRGYVVQDRQRKIQGSDGPEDDRQVGCVDEVAHSRWNVVNPNLGRSLHLAQVLEGPVGVSDDSIEKARVGRVQQFSPGIGRAHWNNWGRANLVEALWRSSEPLSSEKFFLPLPPTILWWIIMVFILKDRGP